jgi:phosphoribosylformylglycinamidine synthase
MGRVRVLVIRAAGINCEDEVMHCWGLAGADPVLLHVNELAQRPALLDDFSVVTIPGGFSYGDDLGAGALLAQRVQFELREPLRERVARGGGVLGICNGFQVLAKMGLLPSGKFGRDTITVTYNDSAKFEARWVRLEVCVDRCPYLTPGTMLEMPVEHAEGKVFVADERTAHELFDAGLVALRYVDAEGRWDRYPANPNGSTLGIAGLCDATGRIFGLMPHPDRHFDHTQHPCWTARPREGPADGLRVFQSATAYWAR